MQQRDQRARHDCDKMARFHMATGRVTALIWNIVWNPQAHGQVSIRRKYINVLCNCPSFFNDGKAKMFVARICSSNKFCCLFSRKERWIISYCSSKFRAKQKNGLSLTQHALGITGGIKQDWFITNSDQSIIFLNVRITSLSSVRDIILPGLNSNSQKNRETHCMPFTREAC
jgi:hypothetical protein